MAKMAVIRSRFLLQPLYLKLATIACAVLGLWFLLLPFVPGSRFSIGSTTLSQREIWSTGVFVAVFLVGLVMVVVAGGLLLAKGWARPILVALPVVQLLPFYMVHWLMVGPNPSSQIPPAFMVAFMVLWAVCWYIYLYRYGAVRRYFAYAP